MVYNDIYNIYVSISTYISLAQKKDFWATNRLLSTDIAFKHEMEFQNNKKRILNYDNFV